MNIDKLCTAEFVSACCEKRISNHKEALALMIGVWCGNGITFSSPTSTAQDDTRTNTETQTVGVLLAAHGWFLEIARCLTSAAEAFVRSR